MKVRDLESSWKIIDLVSNSTSEKKKEQDLITLKFRRYDF
jgi:hypothetical protein